MNTLQLETQYKNVYASVDSNILYTISPVSAIYYIAQYPVKGKHLDACKKLLKKC